MEKYIHVDRCDSTQDLIKEQLTQGSSSDFTVSCDFQTNGRGRGENLWEDSAGTICFSMTIAPHQVASFTALELSVLMCKFFKIKKAQLKLKWPNDILSIDGHKCGGILIQSHQGYWIAGIGLNLFSHDENFGGVYSESFSFHKSEWAKELSLFIRSHRYESTENLINDWMSNCAHLDKDVIITDGDKKSQGRFQGLGKYGEALLSTSEGLKEVFNGTLRLV